MNKIITLIIAGLFLLNIFGASTIPAEITSENIIELETSGENNIIITYLINNYNRNEIFINDINYYKFTIKDESQILELGVPDLPNICRSIIIPNDLKMGVEIIDSEYNEIKNILIAPSKGDLPRTINPDDIPYHFGDIYEKDEWYPGNLADLREPYILRDFRGQVVIINPFQYNPITKTLRIYNKIKINIYPIGPGEKNIKENKPIKSIDKDFKFLYNDHFLNYKIEKYTLIEEKGNMLIITYDDFWSAMIPFVNWKNMKGIPTEMVNLSDIGDGTATAIDNYIEDYYNNSGLTFVLLVGDIDQIPTLFYSGHGSDPSYTYIVGDDNYQDIFIGRFSAQNIEQLETQVERSIEYEKYPQTGVDWYHKGVGIGSPEGSGDDDEYDWEHIRNLRTLLLGFTYTMVDEFYGGSQGGNDSNGEPSTSDVIDALNEGRSILNHCGHGASDGIGWGAMPGWYVLHSNDIDTLINDNMLPFVVLVACNSGEFEHYSSCFAETWMRATNASEPTGAIGVFASTQSQSWDPPMEAQDEIIDLLVNSTFSTMGGLTHSGTMSMMDSYGPSCYDETNTWTLFGDPSLMIYTDTPESMIVDHQPLIIEGATSFELSIDGVEDALCSISYNGQILGYAYTDINGDATINFDVPIEEIEIVDLVITAFNKIPYIISIEVLPPIRQPAEFEPMEAVLIRYPFGISYDIIAEMSEDIEVITIVESSSQQSQVESFYGSNGVDLSNCSFLIAPSNSYWTRDYGPWFRFNSTSSQLEVVDFEYNRPRYDDNAIPNAFAVDQGLNYVYMDIIHAGGNYMTDGHGISVSTDLIYTENPGLSSQDIEQLMREYLGIKTYHVYPDVLGEYIKHIDCWGKFLSPDKIMIINVSNSHPKYDEIEDAVNYFEDQLSCYGTKYDVYRVYTHMNEPYVNSIILNNKVLVPMNNTAYDNDAIDSYQIAMPGYEIIGVNGSWLNTDALHCRAKGIPDRGMLWIEHEPLTDQMPQDEGFPVEVEIITYSGAELVNGFPKVYWKNATADIWNSISMSLIDDTYIANIPPHQCGETISYYINAEDDSNRSENHPYIGSSDPHDFNIKMVPDIYITPSFFTFQNSVGLILTDNLTIGNHEFAGATLNFSLRCSNDSGLGWLSLNLTNGTLNPNTDVKISVIADTSGLPVGKYTEYIIISSNDPDEELITIQVNLTIVLAFDTGGNAVNSPNGLQPLGTFTINATVSNYGSLYQSDIIVNCSIMKGIFGTFLYEDFTSGVPPTGWTQEQANEWSTHNGNTAGGTSPEAYLHYSNVNGDYAYLDSIPVNTVGAPMLSLRFNHSIDWYASPFSCKIYTKADGSDSWTEVTPWSNPISGDINPEEITIDISNDIGTGTQVRFEFDGYYWNLNDWFLDDVKIFSSVSRDSGDIVYTAETTINLEPYSEGYIELSPEWNPIDIGFYAIEIRTKLPGDQDPGNDACIGVVELYLPGFINTISEGWNYISLPFDQSVNASDLLVKHDGVDYTWTEATDPGLLVVDPVVFGWNRSTQSYEYMIEDDLILEPGYGYWIHAYEPCMIWTEEVSRISHVDITELMTQWNGIGIPMNEPIPLSNLIITHNDTNYSWAEASDPGMLIADPVIFGWNQTSQTYTYLVNPNTELKPGYGYWIYAYEPCSLKKLGS